MFNPKKARNYIMKKYIAPVAKNIDLTSEGSLMTLSNPDARYNTEGWGESSNKRQRSASDVIWGFDDEADREY